MQNRDAFKVAFVEADETDMASKPKPQTDSIDRWTLIMAIITILGLITLAALTAV
jgi:hypothetical protein